jgi:hypothetical protein
MAQYWKQTEVAGKQLFAVPPKMPRILHWPSSNNGCSSGLAARECYGHSGRSQPSRGRCKQGKTMPIVHKTLSRRVGAAAISRLASKGGQLAMNTRLIETVIRLGIACLIYSAARADNDLPHVPAPNDTADWIAQLKCSDLVGEDKQVHWSAMLPFSVWSHGYLTGLASALPLDNVDQKKFHLLSWADLADFDSVVLVRCAKDRAILAADAATDAASVLVTLSSRRFNKLRGSNGKWE